MRHRKPVPLALTAAALLLSACSGDEGTTPPDQFAVGPWRGTVGPAQNQEGVVYTFDLVFDQDGRDLSGEGTLRGEFGPTLQSAEVRVDGRFENPDFDFALEAEGYAPVVFDGRVFRAQTSSLDSIAGTLSGSGLSGRRLVLRRVASP